MQTKRVTKKWAKTVVGLAVGYCLMGWAYAVEPFTIGDIRVQGLERLEPGTVFGSLPFKVGDTYSDEQGSNAIRALFAVGLFQDARIDVAGDVVTVVIQERPQIAKISFTNIDSFDKDTLLKALAEVGIGDGKPYDKALVDKAVQELESQYKNKSMYGAKVKATTTPIERNRVNLDFSAEEGEVATIKEINFKGNKAFSKSDLLDEIEMTTGGLMTWYTKTNRYTQAKLTADEEALRAFYLSKGYIEYKLNASEAVLSENKEDIVLNFDISEGPQYIVSSVKMTGDYLGKEDEFKSLITIEAGRHYNAEQVAETTRAFLRHFGDFGYAFAKVDLQPTFDANNRLIALNLVANPGQRAYVRRINIQGNTKTRDEVIRREFRQYENAWYDGLKIRTSRDRVDRLGYFNEVEIGSEEVSNTPDQVDLTMKVTEKPTGNVTLGAGYSTSDKVSFQFGIKQENVFGSGNYLGIDVNTGKLNRTIVVNSIDPYFTKDGISRNFDMYYRSSTPSTDLDGDYRVKTMGTSLKFGVPVTEFDVIYFGVGAENNKIVEGTNMPNYYKEYVEEFGNSSSSIPLTIGWGRDARDSVIAPNSGYYQRINTEWSPFLDANYVKGTYQYQHYFPITKRFTFAYNVEAGIGKGLKGKPLPIFEHYYSGGLGSVRGFEQGSLGPLDKDGSTAIGGAKKFNFNAELITPFPGAEKDRSLRLFAFYDLGNVFAEDDPVRFNEMRSSVGIGLSWISPLGPLRFAYAKPIKKEATDQIQRFQFQVGTSF